jgi:integrase
MRWEHLDLDEGLWCPPAEDQEKATPREIPLPAPVVADIRSLNSRDSGFVFGEGSGTPDNLRKLRVRVAETVPGDWTWHDVRRSFRSSARALGISRDDAEAALGHISHRSKLDRIYDVSDNTEAARLALLRWQSYVLGLIGGDDGEKVIAIRG